MTVPRAFAELEPLLLIEQSPGSLTQVREALPELRQVTVPLEQGGRFPT